MDWETVTSTIETALAGPEGDGPSDSYTVTRPLTVDGWIVTVDTAADLRVVMAGLLDRVDLNGWQLEAGPFSGRWRLVLLPSRVAVPA